MSAEPERIAEEPEAVDVDGAVQEALALLDATPERDPETGRFAPGNQAASKGLAHSSRFWSEVSDERAAMIDELEAELGVAGSEAASVRWLVESYAELRLLRGACFHRLCSLGGPLTSKGAQRAMLSVYTTLQERETRVAAQFEALRKERAAAGLTAGPLEKRSSVNPSLLCDACLAAVLDDIEPEGAAERRAWHERQAEVAAAVGVPRQTLSDWERAATTIAGSGGGCTPKTTTKVAKAEQEDDEVDEVVL